MTEIAIRPESVQDAFLKTKQFISSIPRTELIGRNRTMNAILGETTQLAQTAKEDRDQFTRLTRFDITTIDLFPQYIDAFLYCYVQFEEVAFDKGEALELFRKLEPKAQTRKKKLIRRLMLIAEENGNDDEIKELKKIKMGRGREDLTMDYLKLAGKARRQERDLATLNYNDDEISDIEDTFERLRRLLGSIKTPNQKTQELKLLMEQAYTLLHQKEAQIKKYGQLLFEGTPRAELYKSSFLMQSGRMGGEAPAKESEAPTSEA